MIPSVKDVQECPFWAAFLQRRGRVTLVVNVLEPLRQYLVSVTLKMLAEEIERWCRTGRSGFAELAERPGLPEPRHSLLDVLIPGPSP